MKFYLTIFLFLMVTDCSVAQPFYFKNFQVENGLSNNSVICSLQDKRGFLWLGTKDGLNRFNGYQFKIFRNSPDDKHSLGGNFIHSLHEDIAGQLWVGTDRGLYRFDPVKETFNRFEAAPTEEIREIKSDQDNNLWFIAGMTLYRYNSLTKHCTVYPPSRYFQATSICIVGKKVWIASALGDIIDYDLINSHKGKSSVFGSSISGSSRFIERIFDAGNGRLFISTLKQGVKLFDTGTHSYRELPMVNENYTPVFARDIIHMERDEFWIGTESGIFIYQMNTNSYVHLRKQYNNPFSLSDNAVYTLCRDKEGGMWVGTYFGGVNRYATQNATFEKYFPKIGENAISGNAVREMQQDSKGNIWIGTEDGGLNKLNPKGGFTSYQTSSKAGAISTNNIHGLLVTGDTIWIGTFENGLDIFSISKERVVKHFDMGDGLSGLKSNFIYQIFRAENGGIWLATGRGVYTYDFLKHRFQRFSAFPDLFYTEIYEDSAHNIWAGTYNNGIYVYNKATKTSDRIWDKKLHKHVLSDERINAVYEDGAHRIWIGTERGLYRLEKDRQELKKYSVQTGLPSDVIYAILPDKYHRLWISTSKGLVCLNPYSGNLDVFTTANGLLSDQFNYRSFCKDGSGRLYFGSVKGLIRFFPFVNSEKYTSPNYITGIQIDNKEITLNTPGSPLKKSILLTDTVRLDYWQSSFSIDFASLSYTSPQTTRYRYRLEGLDNRWTLLKNNRRVYFTRVAPGSYRFSFKSANYTGAWSPESKSLTIIISPPFWAGRWAYILYIIIGGVLIYLIFKNYKRKVDNRHKRKIEILRSRQEKEVYESKISFFTNVAHEIRTPLSLIMAPMERVIKEAKNVPAIQFNLTIMEKNANRLLELTNQLLDFRKTEVNGYDLNFVRTDINELLGSIFVRFRDIADQRCIDYHLFSSTQSFEAYIDRETFAKIISNLIDNAIKYAASGVSIHVISPGDNIGIFSILVKNDGQLIPQDKAEEIFEAFYRLHSAQKSVGTGLGLPLSRSLAVLHRGTLSLLPSKDQMNTFELVLPIHQEIEFDVNQTNHE
ncbi:two-component regulator propeller domain-containing protein [Pedobacter miscanthi]|uniref:ligand-binding sensor domain-containing protein n=1 Tax=Pedobacter miscanthi TaxID=2259170 RepID=UPI00292CE856|nr:two-component regulator propeller domain-containing protein [Pedobacter miscanthi]